IRHHREVDRFTDCHGAVMACVDGIKDDFGIYGPIVADVMFDHFLLDRWPSYTRIKKETFFASIYQSLTLIRPEFPPRYKQVVERMLERRWLRTYEDISNVAYALRRVGERFDRTTPLADALPGIKKHYPLMAESFIRFFPELQRFADSVTDALMSRTIG
ncbi:MAG: acyl carrier protein phosphodiesterase, partial [Deltaproteobacteria bacterium]|nr:acyl carrier protein phosphodiesterase [Deltaproteobacteria bacterium]